MRLGRRYRCGNAEDIEQTQKDRKTKAPRQLPQVRPRALSNPRPGERINLWNPFKKSVQQTFDQSQSVLFARLPPEIRLRIWFEVLGGHLLHIVRAPKRLLAVECIEDFDHELQTGWHRCWGSTDAPLSLGTTPGFYLGPRQSHSAKPTNLLPLLQTCRMVYKEAIPALYEGNIFDINHVDTPLYLHRSILPQRLSQIRILNFTWDFKYHIPFAKAPYDLATWSETCEVIASLAGLQELTMYLTGETDHIPGMRGKHLWGPILNELIRVRPTKKFHIFLRWSEDDCAEVGKECKYPFRLLLMVEKPIPLVEGNNVQI
ncbi:hypothetical protein PHISCL_07809 [Aspergillus sclerotialis]|uniref:DUF7730 domain-containing protein n=1 Tax=Aspergillus sclerotialis TaxID=2070753 RepID=A0A3A2ZC46_9EURO|nr:hypothetical protein PHISCL_07809 [Aspergillus sclerotialis]